MDTEKEKISDNTNTSTNPDTTTRDVPKAEISSNNTQEMFTKTDDNTNRTTKKQMRDQVGELLMGGIQEQPTKIAKPLSTAPIQPPASPPPSSPAQSTYSRRSRSTIFDESESTDTMFSVHGTRNSTISRHRDRVTVFPVGCMGIGADTTAEVPASSEAVSAAAATATSPRRFLNSGEVKARDSGHLEATPKKRPGSARPGARNPLTGEGYDQEGHHLKVPSMHRHKDGNPLLGVGYKEESHKPSKVPPGGFTHKIW